MFGEAVLEVYIYDKASHCRFNFGWTRVNWGLIFYVCNHADIIMFTLPIQKSSPGLNGLMFFVNQL